MEYIVCCMIGIGTGTMLSVVSYYITIPKFGQWHWYNI